MLRDVSVGLTDGLPTWPGSPGFSLRPLLDRAQGDAANASQLTMDVHCGTHVDAPRHFVDGGATIDEISVDLLCGRTFVATVEASSPALGPEELRAAVGDESVERLLLRTANSLRPGLYSRPFFENYVALSAAGAAWVRDRGIAAIGIDYLSIQRYEDPPDAHEVLLRAGIPIIEGLDLSDIESGWYDMLCLPILITGAEAAPARVALRPLSEV